jgi:hypothetical protein
MRAKFGWTVGAALGRRHVVINFHRHGHAGGLDAKSAGRRRLSPGSASPHGNPFGRAILGGASPARQFSVMDLRGKQASARIAETTIDRKFPT